MKDTPQRPISDGTDPVRDPRGPLPLTPPVFYVLLALAEGEKHGYAIMQATESATDGEVTLSAGTLYGIIRRLTAEGWIEECRGPGVDRRRRPYRLREFGRAVLQAETERLEQMVRLARQIRRGRRAPLVEQPS